MSCLIFTHQTKKRSYFKKQGYPTCIFNFIAETDGWYKIKIDGSWNVRMSVTFHVEQTSIVTILNFLIDDSSLYLMKLNSPLYLDKICTSV